MSRKRELIQLDKTNTGVTRTGDSGENNEEIHNGSCKAIVYSFVKSIMYRKNRTLIKNEILKSYDESPLSSLRWRSSFLLFEVRSYL